MLKACNKENHELQASKWQNEWVTLSYLELPWVTMSYHELAAKQKRIDLKIELFFISRGTRGNPW